MIGIDNQTGKALAGLAHLKQSVRDILTTPIGSRVMRREYGSRLFELIDAPINAGTITSIIAATGEALAIWEPRLILERVTIDRADETGRLSLTLYGQYLPNGQPIRLDGILL